MAAVDSPTAQSKQPSGPAWFDPDHFNAAEFDAEKYVSDLRRFVPLDGLSNQLDAHLALLRRKVSRVIGISNHIHVLDWHLKMQCGFAHVSRTLWLPERLFQSLMNCLTFE